MKYEFTIVLHDRDRALLENVQLFFNGIGLLTQKRANYLLFKKASPCLSGGLARAAITNQNLQFLTMRGWLKISVRGK